MIRETKLMQVLVIDDAKAMRMILRQILSSLGFEVTEARNGREGLEQLKRMGHLELALVDSTMPDMDGIAFVRAVRANPAYDAVRLMMVTSEDEPDSIRIALQAGANEYLTKPFARPAILEKLQRMGVVPTCV